MRVHERGFAATSLRIERRVTGSAIRSRTLALCLAAGVLWAAASPMLARDQAVAAGQPPVTGDTVETQAEAPRDDGLIGQDYAHIGDFARTPPFPVEISGQFQFRYIYNARSERDDTIGFQVRRLKLDFEAKIPGTDMELGTTIAFDRDGGRPELNDATISIPLADGLRLSVGQFRPPFLREQIVSSKRQLAVERSTISRAFGQERIRGIALVASGGEFRGSIAVMDGSPTLGGDQHWEFDARGEWLAMGRWRQFRDFTSPLDSEPAVMLGAGLLFFDADEIDDDDDDEITFRWTLDASVELSGTSLFAAVVGSHSDREDDPTQDQFGVVVQGGRYISETLELFARYEWGDADRDSPDLSLLTAGANHYIAGHAAKLTADLGFAFNEVGGFWDSTGTGWLRDRPGEDGQVVGRVQMQLLF